MRQRSRQRAGRRRLVEAGLALIANAEDGVDLAADRAARQTANADLNDARARIAAVLTDAEMAFIDHARSGDYSGSQAGLFDSHYPTEAGCTSPQDIIEASTAFYS